MKSTGTDALSQFRDLEGRIRRLLDALAEARNGKAAAERAVGDAQSRIRALQTEIEEMRAERLKIRNRVERLISVVSETDQRKEEKIV